jgi:catechol 2,3-dioxygenase-like lactoylglutathione lyase family enzyme
MPKPPSFALVILVAVAALDAQAPAPTSAARPTGLVVGSGNFFSPIVSNLDRAVAFYRDGLGLQVMGEPSNADENAPLRNMFGLPDARLRWQVARLPGMRNGIEIVEVSGTTSHPLARGIYDPGAFTLVTAVRDIDEVLSRLKAFRAAVVTPAGAPIAVTLGGGPARAVLLRTPDGHYLQLVQPQSAPKTDAPPASAVIDLRVRLTVDNVDAALRLYRDVLGVPQQSAGTFTGDRAVLEMLGLRTGQYRLASLQVPGSGLMLQFIEFKGVERHPIRGEIDDPGSTRLQLQVRDLDAAIRAIADAGGGVVSTGAMPVEMPAGRGGTMRAAIVRDPNNLFLVLIQAPPAP